MSTGPGLGNISLKEYKKHIEIFTGNKCYNIDRDEVVLDQGRSSNSCTHTQICGVKHRNIAFLIIKKDSKTLR